MIDLDHEQLLTVAQACDHFPRVGNRKVSTFAVYRWLSTGVRGTKLESVRVGGRVCTSAEAVQRFLHRANAPTPTTPAPDLRKQHEAAEAELAGAGFSL